MQFVRRYLIVTTTQTWLTKTPFYGGNVVRVIDLALMKTTKDGETWEQITTGEVRDEGTSKK